MKKLIFDIKKNKSRFINIRLMQEDYDLIFQLAKKGKVSMSEVCRVIIRDYFRKVGTKQGE